MSTKKIVAILAGIALVAFGVAFLSFNLSGGYKRWRGVNNLTDVEDEVDVSLGGVKVNENKVNFNSKNEKDIKRRTVDEEKIETLDKIEDINIENSMADINIITENRKNMKVYYHGSISAKSIPELKIKKAGNKLNISVKNRYNVFDNIRNSDLKLDIFIPSEYKNNICVESHSGDTDISDIVLKRLNIISHAGDISVDRISADNIKVSSHAGDMKMRDVKGNIEAKSSAGDTIIYFDDLIDDVDIRSSAGDIEITIPKSSDFYLDASATAGDIIVYSK